MVDIPPPPPGFQIETGSVPPPPAGFVVQQPQTAPDALALTRQLARAQALHADDAAHAITAYMRRNNIAPVQLSDADKAAAGTPAPDVAFGNGVAGTLGGLALGAIHHAANIPLGIVQLATNAAAGVGDALGTKALDPARNALNRYIQNREQNYQDVTNGNVASYAGAAAGEVLPWMVGLGELRAAGMLPKAAKLTQKLLPATADGAAVMSAQPVTGDNYARTKALQVGTGTLTGLAGPVVGAAAGALGRAGRNTVDLFTDAGRNRLAAQRTARMLAAISPKSVTLGQTDLRPTLAALTNAAPQVAGETVGAPQAIGGPFAAQLARTIANDAKAAPVVADAMNANRAARLDAVRQVAGIDASGTNDAAMAAAKQARSDATQPYIQQHLTPQTPLVRWTAAAKPLDDVLANGGRMSGADRAALTQARNVVARVRGGSMQEDDAMQALHELEETVTSKKAQDAFAGAFDGVNQNMVNPQSLLDQIATMRNTGPGARVGVRSALDQIAKTITESRNTLGMVPMDVLDSVRQNLSDFLVSPSGQRATAQETALLDPVRDSIVRTLQRRAPGYSDYLAKYAQLSQPINTMERTAVLVGPNAAAGHDSAGGQVLTPAALSRFLRQDDAARYKIAPAARQQLEAIRDSAMRDDLQNVKIGTNGSDTSALLRLPPMGGNLTAGRMRLLGGTVGLALEHALHLPGGYLTGAAGGLALGQALTPALERANSDIVQRTAANLMNARRSAAILSALNPPAQQQSAISRMFRAALPYDPQPRYITGP